MYHNEVEVHHSPTYQLHSTVCIKASASSTDIHTPFTIIGITQRESEIYTLQDSDTSEVYTMPKDCITPTHLNTTPSNVLRDQDNCLLSWIKNNAPENIFTPGMSKSKRETLVKYADYEWYMHISHGPNLYPLLLEHISHDALHLIRASQLTRDHPPLHTIFPTTSPTSHPLLLDIFQLTPFAT